MKAAGKKADTLKKLRAFLDTEEPKAIEFLMTAWKNQQSAVSYKELRELILSRSITTAKLEQRRLDYSKLVNEKLAPQWLKAMAAAAEELKKQYPEFLYNPQTESAQMYIRGHGAELVTNILEEQRNALQSAVLHAFSLDETMTADDLSHILRTMIGLTKPQSIANINYYQSVKTGFLNAGMNSGKAEKKAREAQAKYADKQHRYRAMNIARTELAKAYNQGAYNATKSAQEQGYIGDCKKIWLTADDERVCEICGAIDEKSVNMDDDFISGVSLPPAHPQCRCAVAYEEILPQIMPHLQIKEN
jgi:SPP1 gp7 family putative phage head morphogenesis protein